MRCLPDACAQFGDASQNSPRVYIIILSWNNANDIVEYLESLSQQDYTNYRVVVVDDGSLDNTVAVVRERFAGAHLIENRVNLGYAGRNQVEETV